MVRKLLGNIKGEKGDKGEQGIQGLQGDPGELPEVNANLIPMSLNDWVDNEQYSSTTGEPGSYSGRSRLKTKIPVVKGETYTLSDESTVASKLNGVRWYIFDGGTFVESSAISRGQKTQITMTGDEITFALYPIPSASNPSQFIEHPDNILAFKLERGDSKTKHLNTFKHYDRKISHLNRSLSGSVDMAIDPFSFDSIGVVDSHIINSYLPNINTESVDSNGVFTLSEGAWAIDMSLRMGLYADNEGYFAVALYQNENVVKRTFKSAKTYDSLRLSATLFCNEGDTVRFNIYGYSMTGSQTSFSVLASGGANYLTMKKIGGL